jgi:hypothetical protein
MISLFKGRRRLQEYVWSQQWHLRRAFKSTQKWTANKMNITQGHNEMTDRIKDENTMFASIVHVLVQMARTRVFTNLAGMRSGRHRSWVATSSGCKPHASTLGSRTASLHSDKIISSYPIKYANLHFNDYHNQVSLAGLNFTWSWYLLFPFLGS